MTRWKRLKAWLRRNWKWVAGGFTLLLAVLIGIYYRSGGKSLLQQKKIEVLTHEREAARLEGQRDIIREQEGAASTRVVAIDTRIAELNQSIEAGRAEIDRMAAEEKLAEFKRLGY